jgi:hypothetical protein
MRRGPARAENPDVEWRRTRRYTLELDAEQEPIAGSLTDEDGTNTSFTGWLGLARLLERARRNAGVETHPNGVQGGRDDE